MSEQKFRSWNDAEVIGTTAFVHRGSRHSMYTNVTPSSRARIYRWRHADYQDYRQTQQDLIAFARSR